MIAREHSGIIAAMVVASLVVVGCQPAGEPQDAEVTTEPVFLDPVEVDGDHYSLEFDNDYVRVLREKLPAGVAGARHSHRDRISVYLNDAQVTIYPDAGEPIPATLVAGSTSWGEPTTHRGTAVDAIENLSIELLELGGEVVPLPEPDAIAVDPGHHVVDFENERVRVVRMTYPPGSKTPHHAHRIGFGVFLTDAHGQNIAADGSTVAIEGRARETFWTTGQPAHVTENLGDEDLVVVLVEMKRHPH